MPKITKATERIRVTIHFVIFSPPKPSIANDIIAAIPTINWNMDANSCHLPFIITFSCQKFFKSFTVPNFHKKWKPRKPFWYRGFDNCRWAVIISWSFKNAVLYRKYRGNTCDFVHLSCVFVRYREYREYRPIKCCTKYAPRSHQHSTLFCSTNWNLFNSVFSFPCTVKHRIHTSCKHSQLSHSQPQPLNEIMN